MLWNVWGWIGEEDRGGRVSTTLVKRNVTPRVLESSEGCDWKEAAPRGKAADLHKKRGRRKEGGEGERRARIFSSSKDYTRRHDFLEVLSSGSEHLM